MPSQNDAKRLDELVKMYKMVPGEVLASEADLLLRKWPAYRFMSPFDATLAFSVAYEDAYKDAVRITFDRDRALETKPIAKLDVKTANSGFTQMWIARQHADFLGVPYPWYLEFCLDFATRRIRRYLPRPNQLRPSSKTEVAWPSEFETKWTEGRALEFNRMEAMAVYCVDYDRGLPAQIDFRDLLLDIERSAPGSFSTFVARRVVQRQELTWRMLLKIVDQETLDHVSEVVTSDLAAGMIVVETFDQPEESEFWQSCFGMCSTKSGAPGLCVGCPQQASCIAMHNIVMRKLIDDTGSTDPIRDRRLAGQRRRTAASRAKAKATDTRASHPVVA